MSVAERIATRFPQTFEDVVNAEAGHVFCDEFEDGIRFVILRGPVSLCAYVGVAPSHPIAGWNYDDLPIRAHGGLTYSGDTVHGVGETYWYGWDYSHSGDFSTYYFGRDDERSAYRADEVQWTPRMVYEDSWEARWGFKSLVRLAEQIARRGWSDKAGA